MDYNFFANNPPTALVQDRLVRLNKEYEIFKRASFISGYNTMPTFVSSKYLICYHPSTAL